MAIVFADTKAQLKKLKDFTSREGWQEYWDSLDEWPRKIDSEAAQGGAK